MNGSDSELATRIYQAIQDSSNFSDRTMQSKEFRVGVSDLGFCSERTRRMLDRQVPDDSDYLAAFIGTAIGDHAEKALEEYLGEKVIRQVQVMVDLPGDEGRMYSLTGHPDVILPESNLLLDGKTTYGLDVVRKNGASQQQQFQRHCYAKGAWELGYFNCDLEDVRVGNFWIDRSAKEKAVHVQTEPYSEDVVAQAGMWLDDVVYAYSHQEEARKEPPREMCAAVCGFFPVCRAYDTDVEGRIEDREILGAIEVYREGQELEKRGKALKRQASVHLEGVQGSTGEVLIRWVHVNESEVPTFTRKAYDKLDIRKIK